MKSKIYLSIIAFLFSTTLLLAQKAEKIRGSKVVTASQKIVMPFKALEIKDNLEINLEKGNANEIRIEADDNLHNIVSLEMQNDRLIISTSKEVQSFKKFLITVIYTNDLNLVVIKDKSIVSAIHELALENISFNTLHNSKLFLNVNAKNFSLQADDKAKIELNLKAENSSIELSKSTVLKALVNSLNLKCDLYQKATAVLEGDGENASIRLDNSSDLNAQNFNIKNADVWIEGDSNCSLLAENITITAIDKSETALFGTPKIVVKKFEGRAKLLKKLAPKK